MLIEVMLFLFSNKNIAQISLKGQKALLFGQVFLTWPQFVKGALISRLAQRVPRKTLDGWKFSRL
jgi:hypothetical protein